MMPSSRRGLVPGALLRVLLASPASVALAAPGAAAANPPTEADVEAARTLYREARVLDRQGKLPEAIARAQSAYRIAPTPVIGLELARLLLEAKRTWDGYLVLRAIDDLPPTPRESERGRSARQESAALASSVRSRLGALNVAARRPEGVEVEVDGERLAGDSLGQSTVVDTGAHTVTWLREGRPCASQTVRLGEGEVRAVDLGERAGCAAPPPPPKEEAKDTEPPPTGSPARPPEGASATASQPPAPAQAANPHLLRWIGLGAAATGLVTAGIGEAFGLRAKSRYDGVADQCPAAGCSPAAFEIRQQARGESEGANIALVTGIALAAGGAVAVIYDLVVGAPSKSPVRVGFLPNGVWVTVVTR